MQGLLIRRISLRLHGCVSRIHSFPRVGGLVQFEPWREEPVPTPTTNRRYTAWIGCLGLVLGHSCSHVLNNTLVSVDQ